MGELIAITRPVARKRYLCNACEWIAALLPYDLTDYKLTCSELREVVRARRNNWQIVPGQQYIREIQKEDGELVVWRAIPAIDAICRKYDIYEDW